MSSVAHPAENNSTASCRESIPPTISIHVIHKISNYTKMHHKVCLFEMSELTQHQCYSPFPTEEPLCLRASKGLSCQSERIPKEMCQQLPAVSAASPFGATGFDSKCTCVGFFLFFFFFACLSYIRAAVKGHQCRPLP